MVAGGSGITPMYNVITEILRDRDDPTELVLLYGNKAEEDILLRRELEQLQPRLRLYHTLDCAGEGWRGLRGHVTKEMLEGVSALDAKDTLFATCGPRALNEAVRSIVEEAGGRCFQF